MVAKQLILPIFWDTLFKTPNSRGKTNPSGARLRLLSAPVMFVSGLLLDVKGAKLTLQAHVRKWR